MPTATLRPGAVILSDPAPSGPHAGSVVVGSPPQWADSSDATYGRIEQNLSANTGSRMRAPLDVLGDSGAVTSATVTVRCKSDVLAPYAGDWAFSCSLIPPGWVTGTPGSIGGALILILGGSGIQTRTVSLSAPLAPVEALLRSGAWLLFGFTQGFNYDLTVYEAFLTVTTVDAKRVTRQFPRDDAYGLGAAPRLVPAPRGARIVGGYT